MSERLKYSSVRGNYGPAERGIYGLTATLVDTAGGGIITRAITGCTGVEAAREIAALCDRLGPTWRVRTLSHPLSILGDLDNEGGARSGMRAENSLLGKIGRPDLIEAPSKWSGLRVQATQDRRRKA